MRVKRAREMRQIANDVADRVLASGDGDDRRTIMTPMPTHARDTTFATQLLYRLRDGSQNAGEALVWLEDELEKFGSDAEQITLGEHQTLSSGNVTAGNIIRGLRLINDVEWSEWFEGVSRIDELLRERGDYAALDFESRNQYRGEIEELARRSNLSEFEVAKRATELAGFSERPGTPKPRAARRTARMSASSLSASAVRSWKRRSATSRPSTRRFVRAFRAGGWLGHRGPGLRPHPDP